MMDNSTDKLWPQGPTRTTPLEGSYGDENRILYIIVGTIISIVIVAGVISIGVWLYCKSNQTNGQRSPQSNDHISGTHYDNASYYGGVHSGQNWGDGGGG
ncbi:unnamed protein product, partial [Owenia fusiformis]